MQHFTGNSWNESPVMYFDIWRRISACHLSTDMPTSEFSSPSLPTITGLQAPNIFMMHGKVHAWHVQRAKSSHVCSYEYAPIAGATCGLIYLPILHKRICPYSCACRILVRQMSAAIPVLFKSLLKGGLLNDNMSTTWIRNRRTVPQYYFRLPQNNLEP
jgi:hypothetical protein